MRKGIILIVFLFLCFLVFSDDEIGVILFLDGNLFHKNDTIDKLLLLGDSIYSNSIIYCKNAIGNEEIQIGINSNDANEILSYSRFPISFDKLSLPILSKEKLENYIVSIGGRITDTRGPTKVESILFKWIMDLGIISENAIQNGFSIVLSKEKSTRVNYCLSPIYFKLADNVAIKEIQNFPFKKEDNDWILQLNEIDYNIGEWQHLEFKVILSNNKEMNWFLTFKVFNEEDINFIEEKASYLVDENEKEFHKLIAKAALFQNFNLKIEAMKILKSIGVSLGGILEKENLIKDTIKFSN